MTITDFIPEAIAGVTITAIGTIIVALIVRSGRRDELDHKKTSDLIASQGAELKRLRDDREADRVRLDKIEAELRETDRENWRLEGDNRRIRRGAKQVMEDLETAWQWIDTGAKLPPPRRPDWTRLKQMLDKPPDHKARLPPDDDKITCMPPWTCYGSAGAIFVFCGATLVRLVHRVPGARASFLCVEQGKRNKLSTGVAQTATCMSY